VITTAARHRSSGEFVAFTSLAYPNAADGRAVGQGYTMVLPDHRGHNLGMRVKINNLRLLADRTHGARRIVTGNAGENDAMLSINRALGFRPAWISGWWEKKLGS
jgi:GNAT superfamily N-acetyltransferase